jgi:glucose-6-phosphate 1-dehydrogenase
MYNSFVLFGATGDLAQHKLWPALYWLVAEGQLLSVPYILCVGRRNLSQAEYEAFVKDAVVKSVGPSFTSSIWNSLMKHMRYESGYFEDPKLYSRIDTILAEQESSLGAKATHYFYLAVPPIHYEIILNQLAQAKLIGRRVPAGASARLLIEKPFGRDLSTSEHLEAVVSSLFTEDQIYRIDHYLGKQTVQNILALRFANGIFEPTWNHEFIDHVQIQVLEKDGVGTRGAFYDGVGALRDMVQNHMLQMLAFVAMEQPVSFNAEHLRDARIRALTSVVPIFANDVPTHVVRGQYTGSANESGVATDSQTETFVALKAGLNTARWKGVPFYLRTGKAMEKSVAEISIHYKKPSVCTGPVCLFPEPQVKRNVLTIRISPDHGVGLRMMGKKSGLGMDLEALAMEEMKRPGHNRKTAYERLILDALRGDQTLFADTREVSLSWRFSTNIIEGWQSRQPPLFPYAPKSTGPLAADELLVADDREWYLHDI